jgi:RNA polymerase sigma-70 factor (ECF subfamily)
MDQREQLDLLSEALEQLPDDERLAVHLYYLDADPVTAASACLGVSRSGFYKLLARARERLADLMSRSPA